VIPPDLIERFLAMRFAMDIGPPALTQAVVADFIRQGHFARHVRRMRSIYCERRSQLMESLRKELPGRMEVTGADAGLHVAVTLPGLRDLEVATKAASQKLWLLPLSLSYADEPCRQGLILGFGSVPAEDLPNAVRGLRDLVG
jgi:GntR family transcriptional regulator/MocR family aminotransferase